MRNQVANHSLPVEKLKINISFVDTAIRRLRAGNPFQAEIRLVFMALELRCSDRSSLPLQMPHHFCCLAYRLNYICLSNGQTTLAISNLLLSLCTYLSYVKEFNRTERLIREFRPAFRIHFLASWSVYRNHIFRENPFRSSHSIKIQKKEGNKNRSMLNDYS
jgi:hypothetical protein